MADRRLTAESDRDFRLIGIASAERDYKLCFALGTALDCEWSRLDEHKIEGKDRSLTMTYAVFRAEAQTSGLSYLLFANKGTGELLLPEAGRWDYLLRIQGAKTVIKEILAQIKAVEAVLAVSEIPLKAIKQIDRLAYEEEVEKTTLIRGIRK